MMEWFIPSSFAVYKVFMLLVNTHRVHLCLATTPAMPLCDDPLDEKILGFLEYARTGNHARKRSLDMLTDVYNMHRKC